MLNKEEILKLGFKELPHYTVGDSLTYDLGRNRWLSIGDLGNPNEMMFIYECDEEDNRIITDIITLHNYDYDGYLTFEKLYLLLTFFGKKIKNTFEEHIKTLNSEQLDALHYDLSYQVAQSNSFSEKMELGRKMNQISTLWKLKKKST